MMRVTDLWSLYQGGTTRSSCLSGCLRLNCLPHRVAELHVCRWVVGRCAAWRALEPLRAPSGRECLAMRFGGRAWLAHLGYFGRGCAHRERAEGHRQVAREQCGASDGRICKEGANSSGEHPMAGCKECVLLLQHMQHAGTQSRGAGLHHTRATAAERQRQSAALHKIDGARDTEHNV
jgi:hypothetical protein